MVWQREALGLSLQTVASNLGVDSSTVSRVVSLFKSTGSVQKRLYPKDARPNKKLTKTVQLTILHAALQRPGIYLRELQTEVFILTGVDVSVSSLCTFLNKSNFTRQRMQIVAKQQDKELREQFAIDVSLYSGVARAIELVGHRCAGAKVLTTPPCDRDHLLQASFKMCTVLSILMLLGRKQGLLRA